MYPLPTGDHPMPPVLAAPTPAILTGPSVSISFDHDAPSGSHSLSSSAHQSSLVHHSVVTEHSFEVNPFATTEHEPFVNVFAPDPNSEASSSGYCPKSNQKTSNQLLLKTVGFIAILLGNLVKYGDVVKKQGTFCSVRYRQEEGLEFEESYAPVARTESSSVYFLPMLQQKMTVYQYGLSLQGCRSHSEEALSGSARFLGDKLVSAGHQRAIQQVHLVSRLNTSRLSGCCAKSYGMRSMLQLHTMTDVDVNAPAELAPTMAPPTRTDDQISARLTIRWVDDRKKAMLSGSIYIQQFWDTIRYDKIAGGYKCQLDGQWFNLSKYTLRDALQITPVDRNNAFSSPPTPDALIKFVNDLGYPKVGKTSGFERPRAPVLQILWGVINRAHIDYAERMWRFTKHICSLKTKKNLVSILREEESIPYCDLTEYMVYQDCSSNYFTQAKAKFHARPGSPLHLPNEELSLGYLKFSSKGTKREVFGMPIPNDLVTDDIRGKQYYNGYLEKVVKHQSYLAGEDPKPAPAKPHEKKRKRALDAVEAPSLAKRSKAGRVSKKRTLQLRDEFIDEGVPATEPRVDDEEAIVQKVLEESMKDAYPAHRGPLPFVVFREPDFGKLQPLPEVQGKGKEKRRTPVTAEPSGLVESYECTRFRDGRVEQTLGDAGVSQTPFNVGQMEMIEFTATLYPKVQENLYTSHLKVREKSRKDKQKANTEAEVQSMVTVPILQDTSSVPLMTTPVIDITDPQSNSTMVPASMPITIATTIGQLEQNIADLVDANQALEERLDKQGNMIHQLETQDLSRLIREQTVEFIDSQEIDRKIKESMKEVVTTSVQHSMRAHLRARFKDLPTPDMKEILL
ncbi:hypothetical protein Tco_1498986 [Tanacetum coccineum]